MSELRVSSIEDGVIRLCTAAEPVSRIVVDSCSTTFLAYNVVHGYSEVDFYRPDNAKLRELAAIVELHCDLNRSDMFFTGLYRDMIAAIDPKVEVFFAKDGVLSKSRPVPGAAARRAVAAVLKSMRAAPRGQGPRHVAANPPRAPVKEPPRDVDPESASPAGVGQDSVLVAFGDSYVAGEEIDRVELGRKVPRYRIQRAFPNVMARELAVAASINLAESGCGNNKILRNVCDFVFANRSDLSRFLFVVGLSHPTRKVFTLKNGAEYSVINGASCKEPRILGSLSLEVFEPIGFDPGVNEELEHKLRILSAFLRRLGCRFVVFPAWNFCNTREFFRAKDLGQAAAFYFDQKRQKFGMASVVEHLPRGAAFHPLSEGHALFARELAALVRARGLF